MLRRLWRNLGIVLALGLCMGIGLVAGLLAGERGAYHHRYLEEREQIEPFLKEDPAFRRVGIEERSDGGALLSGQVPTTADLGRLRERVIRAVGESRGEDAVRGVDVTK